MENYDFRISRAKQQIADALGLRPQTPQPAPQRMPMPQMQPPPQQVPQQVPQGQPMPQQMPQGQQMQPAQPGLGAQTPAPFAKGGLAMAEGGAWTRKEGKNPSGGLNAKGRASLKAQGHDIKPPVSAKQAKKSPKAAARRKSFCARMSGMPGPMKDDNGKPTRKALSLRKWDC
jgi:hypothetical protein